MLTTIGASCRTAAAAFALVLPLGLEGQTPSLDFVWGKHALLAYVLPEPRRREVTLGYTFRWLFGAPELSGTLVKRYRQESKSADVIEVHRYDDIQLVASAAGFVFLNATA